MKIINIKYLIYFSSLFFISTNLSFSQELSPVFEDTINLTNQVRITSFNHYASRTFNNDLMDKFIKGGNISDELKDNNANRLSRLNSFGGESEQKIEFFLGTYSPFKNQPGIGLTFSISDNHFVSANLNSALYKLGFYGNAPYLGDTMDLTFSGIQYQHYQKIGFGFYYKKTMSHVNFSFVNGNQAINFHSGNGWFHSSENSDTVKLNLNGSGFMTDTLRNYFQSNGQGFSIDLTHNFIFNNPNGTRQIVNLNLGNIGAIFWNKNTSNYKSDSLYTYSGFSLDNLINNQTSEFSLDTFGIRQVRRSKAELLPIEFSVQKMADKFSSKKIQAIFGFKAILTSEYRPYLYAGAYYAPNEKMSFSGRLSYGGFAKFRVGLNANFWPTEKMYFALGTFDAIGWISSNSGFGRSINLSALIKF